jgi:hypothetical protein
MSSNPEFVCFSRLGQLGRLGNQLFQIAATQALAHRNGVAAKFPQWEFAKFFENPIDQSLAISDIKSEYIEPSAHYAPIPYTPDVDLFGFFQCEKHFVDCEEVIRQTLKFKSDLLPPQWRTVEADCSVHVRRSDYLSEGHRFVSLGADYYARAINKMRAKTASEHFLVFTDDADWCRKNLPADVKIAEGLDGVQTLNLMSRCKNHIIANSTFSWWGSWLGQHPGKVIFAPQNWYGLQVSFRKNTNYQFCENWTMLSNSINLPAQLISLFNSKKKHLVLLPRFSSREEFLQAELEDHKRFVE